MGLQFCVTTPQPTEVLGRKLSPVLPAFGAAKREMRKNKRVHEALENKALHSEIIAVREHFPALSSVPSYS